MGGIRKSRNDRYLSALRRAEREGGESVDDILKRDQITLEIADEVFAVVERGGKPVVETVSVKDDINVRIIVPKGMKKMGLVSAVPANGDMPSSTELFLDDRKIFWWSHRIVKDFHGAPLDLIRDEVLGYVDKAADEKAWRLGFEPDRDDWRSVDRNAATYLQELPGAFSFLYGVSQDHAQVYIGSRAPAYVLQAGRYDLRAVLVDNVREMMPHWPNEQNADWVKLLLRFALSEFERLQEIMAMIDSEGPLPNVIRLFDQVNVGELVPDVYDGHWLNQFCEAAEIALLSAIQRAKVVSTAAVKEHFKQFPPTTGRGPSVAKVSFFEKLDELLLEDRDAFEAFCKKAGWPFAMSPFRFLRLRIEGNAKLVAEYGKKAA
jgi:hypothetical protein